MPWITADRWNQMQISLETVQMWDATASLERAYIPLQDGVTEEERKLKSPMLCYSECTDWSKMWRYKADVASCRTEVSAPDHSICLSLYGRQALSSHPQVSPVPKHLRRRLFLQRLPVSRHLPSLVTSSRRRQVVSVWSVRGASDACKQSSYTRVKFLAVSLAEDETDKEAENRINNHITRTRWPSVQSELRQAKLHTEVRLSPIICLFVCIFMLEVRNTENLQKYRLGNLFPIEADFIIPFFPLYDRSSPQPIKRNKHTNKNMLITFWQWPTKFRLNLWKS